jgi:hypothetical protein
VNTTPAPATPDQSHVVVNADGQATAFVGKDAVNLYRAAHVKSALSMYAKHKMLMTRGATPNVLLTLATEYTGKTYKRGQHAQAAEDVGVWINTMKAALPYVGPQGQPQ